MSVNKNITRGKTLDGSRWEWRDGYLPDSHLLLFPEIIKNPTQLDSLRYGHSLVVQSLFKILAIPRVSLLVVDPVSLEKASSSLDLYPRWQIDPPVADGRGDYHVFIYGITRRLLESVSFEGLPPPDLLDAWSEQNDD